MLVELALEAGGHEGVGGGRGVGPAQHRAPPGDGPEVLEGLDGGRVAAFGRGLEGDERVGGEGEVDGLAAVGQGGEQGSQAGQLPAVEAPLAVGSERRLVEGSGDDGHRQGG